MTQANRQGNHGEVVVVGAGIIGLSIAYSLTSRGHRVRLIDAGDRLVSGCSSTNAALLTPAMSYPLNGPGAFKELSRSFLPGDSPLKINLFAALRSIPWGLLFLSRASKRHFAYATTHNHRLAAYSLEKTAIWRQELSLKYDNSEAGSLKVFRRKSDLVAAQEHLKVLNRSNFVAHLLDVDETCALEPALNPIANSIAGSLYCPQDEAGDTEMFARQLAKHFLARGGEILLNTKALCVNSSNEVAKSVDTNDGTFHADRIVLATGHAINELLSGVGVRLPIVPLKGYTLTVNGDSSTFPNIPIVDGDANIVLTPLGERLRISGFVELSGRDLRIPHKRVDSLVASAKRTLPKIEELIDEAELNPCSGLRPVSADGLPFIGETSTRNLYVCTGHGHLGWTMAVGSAELVANSIEEKPGAIDGHPYSLDRL